MRDLKKDSNCEIPKKEIRNARFQERKKKIQTARIQNARSNKKFQKQDSKRDPKNQTNPTTDEVAKPTKLKTDEIRNQRNKVALLMPTRSQLRARYCIENQFNTMTSGDHHFSEWRLPRQICACCGCNNSTNKCAAVIEYSQEFSVNSVVEICESPSEVQRSRTKFSVNFFVKVCESRDRCSSKISYNTFSQLFREGLWVPRPIKFQYLARHFQSTLSGRFVSPGTIEFRSLARHFSASTHSLWSMTGPSRFLSTSSCTDCTFGGRDCCSCTHVLDSWLSYIFEDLKQRLSEQRPPHTTNQTDVIGFLLTRQSRLMWSLRILPVKHGVHTITECCVNRDVCLQFWSNVSACIPVRNAWALLCVCTDA